MIILQVIAIIFAAALAKHDAPAVDRFRDGIDNRAMSVFHRYNVWLKLAFCFASAVDYLPNWKPAIIAFLITGLWIYLLFDIVLNISRSQRMKWHYLGLNDKDGRIWNNLFGRNSGKIKAGILLVAIVVVNLFFIIKIKL